MPMGEVLAALEGDADSRVTSSLKKVMLSFMALQVFRTTAKSSSSSSSGLENVLDALLSRRLGVVAGRLAGLFGLPFTACSSGELDSANVRFRELGWGVGFCAVTLADGIPRLPTAVGWVESASERVFELSTGVPARLFAALRLFVDSLEPDGRRVLLLGSRPMANSLK